MSSDYSKRRLPRRAFLKTGLAAAAGLSIYSYHRGLRFPPLSWEPRPIPNDGIINETSMQLKDCFIIQAGNSLANIRAYAPNPEIRLQAKNNVRLSFNINNISPKAKLVAIKNNLRIVKETKSGINRTLDLELKSGQSYHFTYQLPYSADFKFASIGDTGGNHELKWCIHRARQLGADFFLHLGDFNYQKGDYQRAIDIFHNAPIPCYITIGNHDFHESSIIYQHFLNQLGPLNNAFTVGKTRFVNLDTAASFLPYSGGQRGELLHALSQSQKMVSDTVLFTHRPLHNPLEEDINKHALGNSGERDYLFGMFQKANIHSMLAGHVHRFNRSNFRSIDVMIVGQGMGEEDLIDYKDKSKIAIGRVDYMGKVNYSFEPLAMPMKYHCHPRINGRRLAIKSAQHAKKVQQDFDACNKVETNFF